MANSWTRTSSGAWEEPFWSLGALPASNHIVLLTNAGWKAVQISANTAQNFPNSLNVQSIHISSPANSFNTLLLNYAGPGRPLTVGYSMVVESNAAATILASALNLAGPTGVGMSIGGECNHGEGSAVTGGQIDIGYIGPGVYNLLGGVLQVDHLWVGGSFGGVFNQDGGTNSTGIVHLESGGEYRLRDGQFDAEVYFNSGSVLHQQGGRLVRTVGIWRGTYTLQAGVNIGGVTAPVSDGFSISGGSAAVIQTGGTNAGPLQVGGFGNGSYMLSNGVIRTPGTLILRLGHVMQWGGWHSSTGMIGMLGDYVDRGVHAPAFYTLGEGRLDSPGLYIYFSEFTQHGGTNDVRGELKLAAGPRNRYELNGGLLVTDTTAMEAAGTGGFVQNGGIHIATNTLAVGGNGFVSWNGYLLNGGQLVVSNIFLGPQAIFTRSAGIISHSGRLTLAGAVLRTGPGLQQFGRLQLSSSGGDTNSTIAFPSDVASVLTFTPSQTLLWSNAAVLTVENWQGATTGGGTHQLRFGDSSALTMQQLGQIVFRNPAGMPAGTYSARMLVGGEVVPDAPTTPALLHVGISTDPGGIRITVQGEPGTSIGIETSSNLLHWLLWTNSTATNGLLSIVDSSGTNQPARFYRAVRMQ